MPTYQFYGDNAILITFGNEISESIHAKIVKYVSALEKAQIQGVLEILPAYVTVTIQYDSLEVSYKELCVKLDALIVENSAVTQRDKVRIPVCYHPSLGIDLEEVQVYTGLSQEQIISIHTETEYLVYMLGFVPGFFYLGGMDHRLYCPRKKTPRIEIEAGSVAVSGGQTGVYPLKSPGGWQIIGKTPMVIFDKTKEEDCCLVAAGDRLQFYEISLEEYKRLKR